MRSAVVRRRRYEIEDAYVQTVMERYRLRTKTAPRPGDSGRDIGLGGVRQGNRQRRGSTIGRPHRGRRTARRYRTGRHGRSRRPCDERRETDVRRLLLRFHLLRFDAATDFEAAARIYRRCRRAGITPRGMIDCMIIAVAWRSGLAVLAFDADFDRVAQVVGVAVDEASLTP